MAWLTLLVVCSPWFSVLDVALPLAVAASRSVVCMHVPGHYVASGLEPRYTYLRELQRQGRAGWLCCWVCPEGPWAGDVPGLWC
jgi:hypothetical protein